jgi:hypothetical protein
LSLDWKPNQLYVLRFKARIEKKVENTENAQVPYSSCSIIEWTERNTATDRKIVRRGFVQPETSGGFSESSRKSLREIILKRFFDLCTPLQIQVFLFAPLYSVFSSTNSFIEDDKKFASEGAQAKNIQRKVTGEGVCKIGLIFTHSSPVAGKGLDF